MSRSASDATRFTATSPNAQSKPASQRASPQYTRTAAGTRTGASPAARGRSGGPGSPQGQSLGQETPQEKVARLRAAHAAKRAAEISTWDRVIIRGRSIADSAHRLTIFGLVGLSAIAGAVTIYSLVDLSRYNRQKKRDWLAQQYDNLQHELIEAAKAERAGTATPEQMLLLNRERVIEEARIKQANKRSISDRVKGLFSTDGLKKEEKDDERVIETELLAEQSGRGGVVDSIPTNGPVSAALAQHRGQGASTRGASAAQSATAGGQLDQLAASAAEHTKRSASSWGSWLGFGSSK